MQADQSLLNDFFKGGKWNQVPHYYNMMKRCFLYRPDLWEVDKIKIIHYTGNPTSPIGGQVVWLQLMDSDTTRHDTTHTKPCVCVTSHAYAKPSTALGGKPWQTPAEWKEKDFEDNTPYEPLFALWRDAHAGRFPLTVPQAPSWSSRTSP